MFYCKFCGSKNEGFTRKDRQFCGHVCQQAFNQKVLTEAWLNGEIPGWKGKTRQLCNYVRKYLHETRGTACEDCGWDKRHPIDGAVLTEIDHKDGDAENCSPDNLKILCPNCHSMTPTFRRRNLASKRFRK
jgi:5-methylcytosine-specific restriction endonuclease McrA